MSTIVVSFRGDDGSADDVVGAAVRVGFPLQASDGGFLVLHGQSVGKAVTSQSASAILRAVEDAELLLFIFEDSDRCVACSVRWHPEGRVVVQLNLSAAAPEEVEDAARAVAALLDKLPEPHVEGTFALPITEG